jgi:hypothetical protein
MAFCANCGSALSEGQRFCPACGRQAGETAAGTAGGGAPQAAVAPPQQPLAPVLQQPPLQYGAAPAPPSQYYAAQSAPPAPPGQYPPQSGYQQPGWAYYPQGQQPSAPRRGHKGLWIGLSSAAVIIAVACVLVFVVFRGDIFGGGGASSPEQAVKKLMSAYEKKDVDAIFDLIDPEALSTTLDGQTTEEAKAEMEDAFFGGDSVSSIKFSGIKMSSDQTSDTTAIVALTAGEVTITDANGEKTVNEMTDSDTIGVVKRDGSWYIDPEAMFLGSSGGGVDVSGSTTDTTDMGPGTTIDAESTSTTLSGDSTSSTTFTTSTAVGGGSGAKTPQEVVMKLFAAMEDKDMQALTALFDPVALEELTGGTSLDEFFGATGSGPFDFQSVEFSGIEVSVDFQDDSTATVTVTEGTVTMTDVDGYTTSENVTESSEPVTFQVLERDGYWYADPSGVF